jgi:hypothetical protein
MSRGFGLVSLVCALAIVAGLWTLMARETGPTSERVKQAEAEATAVANSINFTQAGVELEAYRLENATYAGAALPPAFGVRVVRADAASYCLQAGVGAAVQHYAGPGGSPAAGPC